MAPTLLWGPPAGPQLRQVSRSVSSGFSTLSTRSVQDIPLSSLFAVVVNRGDSLSARAASVVAESFKRSPDTAAAVGALPALARRQQGTILAIPTTYAGLNDGPAPGAVVGIVLGSVAGFILCLYVLLFALQSVGLRGSTVVEEKVVTTHRRSRSRSHSRHRPVSVQVPAVPQTPTRRETIVIEETVRRPRSPSPLGQVIVEEHEESDIIEVIEHRSSRASPAPEPSRRESRRSGYRTVHPSEFGGGTDPLRRVRKN